MKLTKKHGDESTLRKVWDDKKEKCYGIVGTVADLRSKEIITWSDYPANTWLFIPAPNTDFEAKAGETRIETLSHLMSAGR